jgi:hypothetical protein
MTWFHTKCVNIKEVPDGDWYCDECYAIICEDAVWNGTVWDAGVCDTDVGYIG